MDQTNRIIILIKYDYRNFYFFTNQINSYKEQYFQKYNQSNKYEVNLVSKDKYYKRIKKKKYYENLYLRNKYYYYIIFTEKVISKYLRKQLYKDLLSLSKSVVISLILEYFGFKKKIKKYIPLLN